jgi:hypothetical protein
MKCPKHNSKLMETGPERDLQKMTVAETKWVKWGDLKPSGSMSIHTISKSVF